MESVTVPRGTVLPLAKNGFSKEGNMFVSWNTSADGRGAAYTDETGIIVSGDIVLYAQWAVPHTVTFHRNISSGDSTSVSQIVPERIYTLLDQSEFVNGNKIIAYWTTESDGSGTKYMTDGAIKTSEDTELYAVWKEKCMVTFNTGFGSSVSGQIVAEGTCAKEPAAPKLDGYRFMGWYADEDCTIPFVFETMPIAEDTVIFASWKQVLSIKYDSNGGSGEIKEQTLLLGEEITLRENTFTRTEYGFACWNTSAEGDGDRYENGESLTPTESLVLYAQWGKTCTLQFNKNNDDAEGEMEEVSVPAGSSLSLPANTFSLTGFYCSGWNTSPDGSGASYTNGQTIILNESLVLYAQWKEGSGIFYDVNLADLDNGEAELSATRGMSGDFITLSTTPAQNYKVGSVTVTSASGTVPVRTITENESYQFSLPEEEVTVTVEFVPDVYYLSFDSSISGCENFPQNEYVTIGSPYQLPSLTYIYSGTGYTFKNWNTSADGTGTSYSGGSDFTGTEAITLYAQWTSGYSVKGANLGQVLSAAKAKNLTTAKVILTDTDATSLTGTSDTAISTVAQALKANSTVNVNLSFSGSLSTLGDYAFYGCSNLKSITLPSGLKTLGDYSFCTCSGLTSITIPSSVTSIGSYAFRYCMGITSITVPSGVTDLLGTFYGCYALSTVSLPANLETIGAETFEDCSALSGISIPSKVENIGEHAFAGSGLTTITIPATVRWVSKSVCYGCKSLKTAYVRVYEFDSDGNYNGNEIGDAAFVGCTSLTTVQFACSVPYRAFEDCTSLSSVTFTQSKISSIGESAFSYSPITSITLPSGLDQIGNGAFCNSKLKSITIPASVSNIQNGAFQDCTSLTSASFASGSKILKISENVFRNTGITSFSIPSTVREIGAMAFMDSKLTSITIPSEVGYIENRAFDASTLTSVTFANTGFWKVYSYSGATSGDSIVVTDSATNATNLKGTWSTKILRRNGYGL